MRSVQGGQTPLVVSSLKSVNSDDDNDECELTQSVSSDHKR